MAVKSRYSCIWEALKLNKVVKIKVPAKAHARLKHAVIKRKDLDLAYKFQCSEANHRALLSFTSDGDVMEITLHLPVNSLWL